MFAGKITEQYQSTDTFLPKGKVFFIADHSVFTQISLCGLYTSFFFSPFWGGTAATHPKAAEALHTPLWEREKVKSQPKKKNQRYFVEAESRKSHLLAHRNFLSPFLGLGGLGHHTSTGESHSEKKDAGSRVETRSHVTFCGTQIFFTRRPRASHRAFF